MPIYQRNGKTYNIPDSEVDGFEKTYPDATQKYVANGRNYNIPVSERDGFISTYKDATPFDRAPSASPEIKSDPPIPVDSQRMDSTRDYKPAIQEKPYTDFDLKKEMNGPTDSERREQERKRIEEQVRLNKDENEKDFRNAKENKAKADYEAVANSPFSFISEILFGTQTPKQVETQKKAELSRASLEKTNDAFNMIEEAKKKGNTTFVSGFGRGFWEKISKVSTLDFGAMDSQTNLNILSAAKKYEAGQSMTGEEEALLDAVALEAAANGEFSGDLGRGYKAGSTTAESLPFMAEFMINPATGTGRSVGKAAAKKIISNFGKEAAKSTIGKIARNSARVAGDVAGAGIMAGTTGAMRITADVIERSTGDVNPIVDGDGYYRFGGNEEGDGALESFAKAYGASTIENFSEMFGNYLAPIGSAIGAGAGKVMNKIGLGKVNKIIGDIKSSDIAKAIDDFQSKTQWNGTIGEYLEEQAGMAMNALTVGDNSLSDMIDPDTQIDTFLGVSAMGGLFSSVKTAGYAKEKYSARKKLNEADRFAADPNVFGEEWTEMKERIDQADDSELVSVLSETMANESISDKGKQAVLVYAGRLKAYHGASLADLKRKTEGDTPDEVVQSQMNFDEGYRLAEADRTEKRSALRQLDKISEKLDMKFLLNNNSDRYDLMRQRAAAGEDVTNELACINAQSRFDGMILGIRNAIDEKVSVSNQYITNLTHQDGNVYDVTLTADEKKHVFPISGSIVVDENGIIDRKQSDSRFIVRDDTGKIEMRSIDDLYKLESSDNAVALKEVTAQSIREQESARHAEEIETPSEEEKAEEVASVQPGDVISLDMQGIKTTATVQSKRDGSTVLLFDEPIEYDGKKSQTIELSDEQVQAIIIPEGSISDDLTGQESIDEDILSGDQSNMLENGEELAINEKEASPIEGTALENIPVEVTTIENAPIQEEIADIPVEAEVLQENQAMVIPVDKKGNKIYHKAPVGASLEDMRAYGLDDVETDEFVNAQKVEAAKRIEKLEKSKPKVGTNLEKYQADKKAWADEIADAQAQVGYWGEVEEQIRAIRVQPGDVAAEAIMQMGDPMNGEELASMMLGTGRLPILYDSYKKETGGRNAEARGMLGLFANKSNGGVTIEEAGEQLMLADLENGTNFFDQNDPNAGRNAIIEVLAGARTRGDLFNYIKNSREVTAERERAAEYNAYTQWCEDNFHMTPEDHALYEDALPTVLEENAFAEDEYNEFMSTFVEQLNNEEYDTERIRNEAQSNEQTGSDGIYEEGNTVLQGEELVSSGRDGNIEERSEEVGNDVDNSDESVSGSASRGEVELSSRDSEDGTPSTLPLNEFLERRPVVPSYLYHGSPDGDLNMIDPFAHTQNWKEGIGFYTTESRDAAEMYANGRTARGERKSNVGKVNYIKPNPDARILDMDAEIDAKLWEGIATNMDLYPPIDAKTNREAYIELIEMADDPEAQYAVEEALLANGYDASTHMEGKNGNPHRVTIWKNPDKLPQIIRPEDVYSESFSQIDEVDSNEAIDILRQVQGESILDYAERVVKANEIAQEREAVNLNPTDAQKEAGNYKKGHVEIDGFNVTIENPKGGERSGVDANGQPWSVTMNNTYGYLRGTEGADGDHIDLFLSDDPTQGDVFVVDQVKEDGSFDEHKVMYGFISIDEAKEAYLSNYSPGWKGLGNITGVSKVIFKEWVDSSHRKTKAFAEYKIVQESNLTPAKVEEYQPKDGNPILYTHSGKLPSKKGEFCHAERIFTESSAFSFTGKEKIESADDVAYIFRELENAAVENSFAVLVKDHKPTVIHLGMGAFTSTVVNTAAIKAAYNAVGADKIYFVHNHPSGVLKCSRQDVGILEDIIDMFESEEVVIEDGIIIDTTSGEYGTFDLEGASEMTKRPDKQDELPLKLYAFDRLVFSEDYNANNLDTIRTSEDIAALVSSQRLGKRKKVSYIILDNANHVLGNMHTTFSTVEKNENALADEIAGNAIRFGGTSAVVYGNFDMRKFSPHTLNSKIKRASAGNIQLLDCVSIDGVNKRSAVDDNLMEPESTYGDSKTDDFLRYRSSNENSDTEGRYDMALRAQDDFVSRYNSGEILVIENADSVEAQARDAGITDDRTLNDLKEIASDGETSAIYSPYYDKILIFAENGNGDYESSLFHENVHRSINKVFGFDSHSISSLYDGLYKRFKKEFDIIREGYSLESEYNQKEECVAYYLEHLFEKRNLNKISGLIDSSNMDIVDQILNYIGYERKDEQGGGRGRSVLGISEREVGQLRNDEAPEINEKDSGGERPDAGGIRGEDYTGTKESAGDEGTTETEIITSVESLSKELNTPVRIVRDVNELTDSDRDMLKRKRRSKGWFDPKTGEVVFVLPNAVSVDDAIATILHEVVAHRGLREVFGKDFDGFLDNVYGGVSEEIRTRINRMAQKYGFDTRIGTEEYLASLAERGFEDVAEKSVWEKIKELFSDMLRRVGVKLSKPLNDEDLRYILWKSMNRLKDGDNIVDKAEKIAKDREVSDRLFRFREEATEEQENEDIARLEYENALDKTKNKMYRWQEAYQDSMLGLKKLQEAIEQESESKLQHFEDAYMAENQMSSKSAFETEVYKDKFLTPMLDAIKAITDKKVKRDEVNTYVMAKHGLERNVVFAKRDAERTANEKFDEKISDVNKSLDNGDITHDEWKGKIDGLNMQKADFYEEQYIKNRTRDYSGLTQLVEKENEEEDYEVVAKGIVDQFEEAHRELCDKLWEKIYLATKQTLKKSYESGLMTRGTYDKVKNMFEFYVPLRGWNDDIASDVYEYMLSERSVFQAPVKVAFGRKSLADDPFANIGNMAESGILQGNRNLMKQRFLNMVLNHPTSLVTVKTMWYERIVTGDKEEWVESFPEIKEGATPDEISKAIEDHEAEMVELEKNRMATKSTNKIKLDYRASNREKDEHMVVVKNGGKEYVIYVNGNPRAAQAINGLTNPDTTDHKFMQLIGKLNRQLAANFTTRNPAFVLSNMSRDVIFSTSAVWVKENWKYAKRFDKNIIKNIGAIAGLMARYKSGKLNMSNSRDRHFLEFLENGGETGYTALHNVDEYKKMMDRHVKKSNGALGSIGSGVHAIVDAVSFMNRCAENVSRFTTYQTSREMGRGISESVRDAKEVTVNFNKKGAGGLGAGTFKSLFLFFNAAVQSLKNFNDLYGKSKSKFYTAIGGFAAAGILMPMINNAIIEMLIGDDDDEMNDEERAEWMKKKGAYDNLPEWVRKNNLCLWVGGERFVTIPLPIELRAFYGLGEMWYQMGRGNMNGVDGKVDVKKASFEMVNQLTELLPINPMGGNGDALSVIVPDAGKPLYQVFANRDFFGKPIYKEGDYNELMPTWTKAYNGTAKWMVNSAEFINEVSGGDKYKRGGVDLNPATIEHVFEGYLGGMGKTANQLFKTLAMIWDEDGRMWRNVPVANRFISGSDNKIEFRKVNEAYYQCMDELKETEQRLRGYENEAEMGIEEYAKKYDFLNESKEYERYEIMKEYKSVIDDLRKVIKESDPKEKKEIEMEANLLKMEMLDELKNIK